MVIALGYFQYDNGFREHRSSYSVVFLKESVLKTYSKFTGEQQPP